MIKSPYGINPKLCLQSISVFKRVFCSKEHLFLQTKKNFLINLIVLIDFQNGLITELQVSIANVQCSSLAH